jgi:hypothetical protein
MQLTETRLQEVTRAPEASLLPARSWAGIILLVFMICGAIAIAFDAAPQPTNEAASSEFSAVRAQTHLASIARAPHPINSTEHGLVRDYILNTFRQMGMSPEVQKTAADPTDDSAGAIENIVCRLQGSTHDKAVLLVAHYDSVEEGPGASDDGVAVADILETARALKSQSQLKRDIIFLLTDGEEAGLLGARAFVKQHPWAKDAGVVLNFDARGTTGSSIMFETSAQNSWLISNFGAAASHPVANSLSYEIYKRLPNDTDFTIFRRAGYSGLNFAFINGLGNYHSASDSLKTVDPRSLQHDGDYMMELAKQFGNAAGDDPKETNAVYFDVLGLLLVRYSKTASIVFLVVAVILFGTAYVSGTRKGSLRAMPSLLGFLCMILGTMILVVGVEAAAWLISAAHLPRIHHGLMFQTAWYILAFSAFGISAAMPMYSFMAKRLGSDNLIAGALLGWLALATAVTIYVSGASYLLLWPMFFVAAGWLIVLANRNITESGRAVTLALSGIPAIMLMIPMVHKIVWAFSAQSALIVSVLLGLLLALVAGTFRLEHVGKKWALPLTIFAAGVALLLIAVLVSGNSVESTRLLPLHTIVVAGEL